MAKDHFLPAALIGRFSESVEGRTRDRKVWSLRRNGSPTQVRASNIGFANNLYDVDPVYFPTKGSKAIDSVWDMYEPDLPKALDSLISGKLTADEWINIVVPFVGATFARDLSYVDRVASRNIAPMPVSDDEKWISEYLADPTNLALNRLLELERFAARALACKWQVIKLGGDILPPDMGFTMNLIHENPDVIEYLLPIGPRDVLSLIPCSRQQILVPGPLGLEPNIDYLSRDDQEDIDGINLKLNRTAQHFIIGSSSVIERADPEQIGAIPANQLDEAMHVWPFKTESRRLSGLRQVFQKIVAGEHVPLSGTHLNAMAHLREIEPRATMVLASPFSGDLARKYLEWDEYGGLVLDATG